MKVSEYYLVLCTHTIVLLIIVNGQGDGPIPATEQTTILWSLAPCQSAFWIPSTSSEFNQNWIIYQYDGNPLSQFGDCVFTLESDPKTRIEMVIQQVNLFGNGLTIPQPCLLLHDVKTDGNVILLKKECNIILSFNPFESQSTFTSTNLAIISSTIRYGSFQLRARAVPLNYGFPPTVGSITSTTSPVTVTSPTPTTTKVTTEKTPTVTTTESQNLARSSNKSLIIVNAVVNDKQLFGIGN